MSQAQAIAFLSQGLLATGGGFTPPSTYDVRFGVDNGAGDIGTLTSPAEDRVLAPTQYGGDGNQYIGTATQVVVVNPSYPVQPQPASGNATIRAWKVLYRAQTAALGQEVLATVGTVQGKAIVSQLDENEILAAGGTAEAGGYSVQMLAEEFPVMPDKFQTVRALGTDNLQVLSVANNNGVLYIVCQDPVANES